MEAPETSFTPMALHGLCSECDRLLRLYQSVSVEAHSLSKQLAEAARARDRDSYTRILEQCDRQFQTCDEVRALFHQHAISEHGRSKPRAGTSPPPDCVTSCYFECAAQTNPAITRFAGGLRDCATFFIRSFAGDHILLLRKR